jgi:hypothetical protein
MNKTSQHGLKCSAPICMLDKNTNWQKYIIWYPGEKVCDKKPYNKVQKIQLEINKFLNRRHIIEIDKYFTYSDLEKIKLPGLKERSSFFIKLLGYKTPLKKKLTKKCNLRLNNKAKKKVKKVVKKIVSRRKIKKEFNNKIISRNSSKKNNLVKTGSRLRKAGSQRKIAKIQANL